MSDTSECGATTPAHSRFTSQAYTAEDLLKQQTVGLVNLSDFRKRRAEALEQTSRDVTPTGSGAATPDGRELDAKPVGLFKKRKKAPKKGGLSFAEEDGTDEAEVAADDGSDSAKATVDAASTPMTDSDESSTTVNVKKRGLKPNSAVPFQPKAMTKVVLLREARLKEQLRKEYMALQEAVKATDFCLPFVFYDGRNTPGGICRMKKGDFIWLFLERARKVGAGSGGSSRRDWARIGVDDLIVVKGDLIIPHHYDFHYFITHQSVGYDGKPIFAYSAEATSATPKDMIVKPSDTAPSSPAATPAPSADAKTESDREGNPSYLQTAGERRAAAVEAEAMKVPDDELEGYDDDPALTKVVDRRWYEKNKHIFPASSWEEFDPSKDYPNVRRTDRHGNAFFVSR